MRFASSHIVDMCRKLRKPFTPNFSNAVLFHQDVKVSDADSFAIFRSNLLAVQ